MVRIALGQIDPSVGDLEGNVELMTAWASRATEAGADVVVFPELAITGYPPEDLVLRPAFVDDNLSALEHLAKRTAGGCSIVTGFVDRTDRGIHNAAALVANGEIVGRYHKIKLPNYGVFDEQRTFVPGAAECAVRLAGSELGLSVCEDAWAPGPPFDAYAARKTPIVLNINGSPYHRGKAGERIEIARDRALELGLGDYVRKNGFEEVVLGLSGGVDSAFVAALAADTLGAGSVRALTMPSRYSSPESAEDATEVARRLRIRLEEVAIDDVFSAYLDALREPFHGTEPGLAEENIQARIRGNLLMAFSNRFGSMVLATGNKSEYAVGYATLYGDMAGGFAPIKDVPKTLVYELVRWRNAQGQGEGPIPHRVVAKAPSAELRPDQKDTDSLPPYEQLDPIIEAYVVDDRSPEEIGASGDDPDLVERVVQLIDIAEYKRRQAAPGIKITPKAFGRDRRMPITNRYRPVASP